ncbi:Elongation factor 1-gamma [Linderina pennispora]|nr:Elongation factor 1-gamma [Linderina pennispora]
MSVGKFIGRNTHYRSFKVRITAELLGLDLELTPNFKKGTTNKTDDYLAKFPVGKFPAFVGSDGFTVSDSNAIAYYLAGLKDDSPLLGSTHKENTKIMQYVLFAESEILQATHAWQKPTQGSLPYFKPAGYLVGDRLTVADVIMACDLHPLFTEYLDAHRRQQYPEVTRYFVAMFAQPAFRAIAGDVALCETPKAYTPK